MNFVIPPELEQSLEFDELLTVILVSIIRKLNADIPEMHKDTPIELAIMTLLAQIASTVGVPPEDTLLHATHYLKIKADNKEDN